MVVMVVRPAVQLGAFKPSVGGGLARPPAPVAPAPELVAGGGLVVG